MLTKNEKEYLEDVKNGLGYWGERYKHSKGDADAQMYLECALESYRTDSAPNAGCAPDEYNPESMQGFNERFSGDDY